MCCRSEHRYHLSIFHIYALVYCIGKGTPLQYSCLENPMDGAAHGVAKSRTRLSDFTFTFHFSLSCIGGGNGNPLQCSCLENPRDSGAWGAAVYGVAQSRTRLKRLSSSSSSSSSTYWASQVALVIKNPPVNARNKDVSSISGSGRSRLRKWQPTPVLLPGKLCGQRILVGCSPWT